MYRQIVLLFCMMASALSTPAAGDAAEPLPVVTHVDLARYLGEWYEIRKIPNRFQSQCAGNTTATYSLREDGRLNVVNRCRTHDGTWDQADGIARIVDPATNARLEVSFVRLFGWNLFWGDYWIIDLAADYSYVIVGHPQRRYGWILSRTPTLPVNLDPRLRELGYDPADFTTSPQEISPDPP